MPTPDSTTPGDFDPIFSQGAVIVGGQAVNLWASYYAAHGAEALAQFTPFTSKDADIFLRDPALASAVAASAGWDFHGNPEPHSPVVGVLVLRRDALTLQVDVLRAVTGLSDADLALTESIEFENGKSYAVPAPDMMLKAKLANLAQHAQQDRQDEKHVRILLHCCRHYLRDACAAVRTHELTEGEALERFEAVANLIVGPTARQLDQGLNLGLATAIPKLGELGAIDTLPKIQGFYRRLGLANS